MEPEESPRRHRKAYWIIGIGSICLAAFLIYIFAIRKPSGPQYTTVAVKRGDISASIDVTGTINPLTTVPVGSYVSGTVKYIFADFNTEVDSGQVLAQIDPAIYEAQVDTAQGNLQNAEGNLHTLQATVLVDEANLAKAQANLTYEEASAKRSQSLFQQGVVSIEANQQTQSTLGQASAEVRAAQATVNQVKAQVQQAKAQVTAMTGALKQAKANLRYTTILSPITGTVVARNIDVGQSVAASLQAPTLFTIAQDLKRMQIYAKTDESDTGNIKAGIPVSFQVDAFPDKVFHGQVSTIRLNAFTVQNVVTYDTIVDFDNPEEKLLPGETAYVTIPTGHVTNVVLIPNSALSFTPEIPKKQVQDLYRQYNISHAASTTHVGGWQLVWKLEPGDKLAPIAVQCGITDFVNTQLVAGNLHAGDEVITGANSANGSAGRGLFGFGGRGSRR